ncbi:MAG TPA: chorismate mutase [Anaerolineae bacterium]|nr:chorismate mutase [Anaerolineae bacterium]
MPCRGIRGAITVESDSVNSILGATRQLLTHIVEANGVDVADIASVLFTVTPDLTAAFPARAARELGWQHVALLDALEIPVPGSLPRCIRVLVHWNTSLAQEEVRHIYLGDAAMLRSDLRDKSADE